MLEFFRRHRGAFLITVTVVIIISFSVWGGWKKSDHRGHPSETALSVYGRDYSIQDAQRYARRMNVIYMLQLFDLMSGLSRAEDTNIDRGNSFVINQIILQKEMEKMGIQPSDAEAKAAMEKLPALQENGKFSPQRAYNAEQMLGSYGFSSHDMLEVMKLSIGYNKLSDLIGKNYVASPIEAEKAYASEYQTLKVNTIEFKLEDFKKTAEVKDEEIQKYYDEKKDTYKTAEKRAISYVLFENPKPDEKKTPEDTQKEQKAQVDNVNKFNNALAQAGAKFEEVATKEKAAIQKLDLFTQDAAPEAIKGDNELIQAIFALDTSRPYSDPVKGTKGYYIFTVTKTEEPKQQDLAAVKEKIKETLVTQKAQEALSKAVNDNRAALADGLKAGKKIEDLAKEKKLTLSPIKDITVAEPPQDIPNGYLIARQAQDTPAGELTKAIDNDSGSLIVYVSAKELRKRDDSASLRDNLGTSRADQERTRLFGAWFNSRREEAKPKALVTMAE